MRTSSLCIALLLCFGLSGCGTLGLPRIRIGKTAVTAPKDAGTPAQINQGEDKTTIPVPAGTKVVVMEVEAIPATAEKPAVAAYKTTSFDFSQPSQFERVASSIIASTGTVDTSVAKHRIDAEGRKVLLYAAIVAAAVAIGFFFMKWPTPAIASGIGAVVFFLSYQLAGLPPWFWMIGAAVSLAGVAVMLGYKRAEWDANGDGVPDFLQKK